MTGKATKSRREHRRVEPVVYVPPGVVVRSVMVKLVPDETVDAALAATLTACNEAANALSWAAFEAGVKDKARLQKAHYYDLRDVFGLSAQLAVRVIGKVADAYKAGADVQRAFRSLSAVPFDDRILTWHLPEGEGQTEGVVSIRTLTGRVKVPFVTSTHNMRLLQSYRHGESDLLYRDGKWLLVATVQVPAVPAKEPDGFLGVDVGIVNVATTSAGSNYSGSKVNRYRRRQQRLRKELQAKGTKSAKRLLKKRRRKEQRHTTHHNHRVAKQIVVEAQRTNSVIVLENLQGIRSRARLRTPQREALNNWAFHQLGQHIMAKAAHAGVTVMTIDPWRTSQQCSGCGHTEKANRRTRNGFQCRSCGLSLPADLNAADVLAQRAAVVWACVNTPPPQTATAA